MRNSRKQWSSEPRRPDSMITAVEISPAMTRQLRDEVSIEDKSCMNIIGDHEKGPARRDSIRHTDSGNKGYRIEIVPRLRRQVKVRGSDHVCDITGISRDKTTGLGCCRSRRGLR
jgi:hypothetical protein